MPVLSQADPYTEGKNLFQVAKSPFRLHQQLEAMGRLVTGLVLADSSYFNKLTVEARVRSSDHGEQLTPLAAAARGDELLKAFDLMIMYGLIYRDQRSPSSAVEGLTIEPQTLRESCV